METLKLSQQWDTEVTQLSDAWRDSRDYKLEPGGMNALLHIEQ